MSHWAKINEDNIVTTVMVGDNNLPDEGYKFHVEAFGGRWVKTSYNTRGGVHLQGGAPLRKNYASTGYVYDEQRDAFIPPKCHDSATLDEATCLWDCTDSSHTQSE